jgi:hypothetical protein
MEALKPCEEVLHDLLPVRAQNWLSTDVADYTDEKEKKTKKKGRGLSPYICEICGICGSFLFEECVVQ